ncbi:MAG: hypothetical protein JWL75_242 [Parcubacteria group bacterium]|nr:hypothetical protein [Parcubacteria group bacterium]
MVLYMMPASGMADMMKNMTPEMMEQGKKAWGDWMEAHKSDLADFGGGLGKNLRVTKDGSSAQSNDVGGYSIIQAESAEAVAEILASNPSFNDMPESYIEVMEISSM